MKDAGTALMGTGFATGENRAVEAAEKALQSPLIDTELVGAGGILLSIAGGDDLSLYEVNEAAEVVRRGSREHEHHLRRDDRRAADRPGLGDRRGDGAGRHQDGAAEATNGDGRLGRARAAQLPTELSTPFSSPRRPRPGRARPDPELQADEAGLPGGEHEHAVAALGDAARIGAPVRRVPNGDPVAPRLLEAHEDVALADVDDLRAPGP